MADDKDAKRVFLTSYGMMAVELQSTAGERLQLKSGSTATLTSPIPRRGKLPRQLTFHYGTLMNEPVFGKKRALRPGKGTIM
jgi:hypothetical protein